MLTSFEFASAWLQARCKTDRGASLVEYALLVALIAVVCIIAVTVLGGNASKKFSEVGSAHRLDRRAPSAPGRHTQLLQNGHSTVDTRCRRSSRVST